MPDFPEFLLDMPDFPEFLLDMPEFLLDMPEFLDIIIRIFKTNFVIES